MQTLFQMIVSILDKHAPNTAQKMEISIKGYFSKCDQIHKKLKKSLIESFIFVQCKKTKILRGNQKPYFNKKLQKHIMMRSRLKNMVIKSKNCVNIVKYKWQRNLVAYLNKQGKLQYFEELDVDYNSKPFWKACKPYFSNINSKIQENIMLLEKGRLLSKQKNVASTFNKHSGSITDSLNFFSWTEDTSVSSGNDTIKSIVNNFLFTQV